MKKNIFLIALSSFLLLTGCQSGNNPTTTSNISHGINTTPWTSAEIAIMNDAIGTTLPEGPFSNNRESEGYIDEQDGAYTFYMYDTSCGDISSQYATILGAYGYTSEGIDNSYGYDIYFYYKNVTADSIICVQFGYYPGDTEYAAGLDLFAWLYDEDSSNNNPSTGEVSQWTNDEKSIMNEAIGMVLPDGPFSNNRESEGYIDETDGAYTFYMYDPSCGNVSEQYASILENNGWTFDGIDNSYGYDDYLFYIELSSTEIACVEYFDYPGDEEFDPGLYLYAWIYTDSSSDGSDEWPYASWDELDVNSYFTGYGTIPEVPGYGYDFYYFDETVYVFALTDSNIEDTYTTILENDGWTVDETYYAEYGIIANKGSIEMCFYYDTGYLTLVAYVVE